MIRIAARNFTVMLLLMGLVSFSVPENAGAWTFEVNGLGYGTVGVQVWCAPNGPPALPNYVAGDSGWSASASLGPGLAACHPITHVSKTLGPLWSVTGPWKAAGGDSVDAPDLLNLVTPTSYVAYGDLNISAKILSGQSAEFTIQWSGSDPGVAAWLGWYEGENMLNEVTQVGPWSETLVVAIDSIGSIEDVVLKGAGIALSKAVPEPATLGLVGAGFVLCILAYRRQQRHGGRFHC